MHEQDIFSPGDTPYSQEVPLKRSASLPRPPRPTYTVSHQAAKLVAMISVSFQAKQALNDQSIQLRAQHARNLMRRTVMELAVDDEDKDLCINDEKVGPELLIEVIADVDDTDDIDDADVDLHA